MSNLFCARGDYYRFAYILKSLEFSARNYVNKNERDTLIRNIINFDTVTLTVYVQFEV